MKRRAIVSIHERNKVKGTVWGYGYADLSLFLGRSESMVRQWVYQGVFNPGDLLSVMRQAVKKNPLVREVLLKALVEPDP
jgi:hypothetical protein